MTASFIKFYDIHDDEKFGNGKSPLPNIADTWFESVTSCWREHNAEKLPKLKWLWDNGLDFQIAEEPNEHECSNMAPGHQGGLTFRDSNIELFNKTHLEPCDDYWAWA